MPIIRLLRERSFAPEQISVISEAFDGACKELGLADRADPLVEMVAKAVIACAEQRVDSAEDISRRALAILKRDR